MAFASKILLVYIFLILSIVILKIGHVTGDQREYTNQRLLWPVWFHENLARARHDRDGRSFPATQTNSWNRNDLLLDRASSTVAPQTGASRHHVDQRVHEQRISKPEKFSAVAVAEYGGTRAIAYAGYHNNHRHQPREAVTQSYQHLTTTPSTYTKHHPGAWFGLEAGTGANLSVELAIEETRMDSRCRLVKRSSEGEFAPDQYQIHSTITIETGNLEISIALRNEVTFFRHLNIFNIKTDTPSLFLCCPGWTQATHLSFGCNKPACPSPCSNGGICTSPGRCTCPKGFTGNQCQTDIDECVTEKPCDQLCRNLPGTYECHCKPGFQLQKDGQSCRKNDTEDTAFEARDLEDDFHEVTTTRRPSITPHDTENEVADGDLDQDYEIILKRLTKLEKQFAKGKKRDTDTTEMSVKVQSVVESINEMRRAVENVQLMQQEMYEMRSKLREYELEARKMQHLTSRVAELENRLRLRCRSTMPMKSGTLNF
ncbi:Epidermal growth factor-like protein 7 [Anthophora retusa]